MAFVLQNLITAEMGSALELVTVVLASEHYHNGSGSIFQALRNRVVASKIRDCDDEIHSNKRDALKFYRKRISCNCLKRMHLEARKTLFKIGMCWYCKEEKVRVTLDVCSRCRVSQYCSKECQVAAWPVHKMNCDKILRATGEL